VITMKDLPPHFLQLTAINAQIAIAMASRLGTVLELLLDPAPSDEVQVS
jgi:hypothetical protein